MEPTLIQEPQHDALGEFAARFFSRAVGRLNFAKAYNFGPVQSVIVHREPPFQVELVSVKAGPGAGEPHRHPNVDTIEVCLLGQLVLIVNGKSIPISPGNSFRVWRQDWHTAGMVLGGATFYSFQQWDDGVEPTSAGLNWEGSLLSIAGPEHIKLLRQEGDWWRTKRTKK